MLRAFQVMTQVNRFPHHIIVSSDLMEPRTFLWTTGSRSPLSAALFVDATRGSSTYRNRSGSALRSLTVRNCLRLRDLSVCVYESSDTLAQHVAHTLPFLKGSVRLEPDPVYLPELVPYRLRLGAAGVSFHDVLDLVEDVRPAPLYPVFPVRYQPVARLCPTGICHLQAVRHIDPLIAAPRSDIKETRSTTVRPGSAVPVRSYPEYDTEDCAGSG